MHLDHQVPETVDPQHIPRRQYGSRAVLGDDGRPGKGITGVKLVPLIDASLVWRTIEIDGARANQRRRAIAFDDALTRRLKGVCRRDQTDPDINDFERASFVRE